MTKDTNVLPYRPGVGALIVNSQGLFLAGDRLNMPDGSWQLPQGGIDQDETPNQALVRELKEEISVSNYKILAQTTDWIQYDIPDSIRLAFSNANYWSGFSGQQHIWYLLCLENESEIDIQTECPEFSDWCWASQELLMKSAPDFKKEAYQKIFQEFQPVIHEFLG